MEGDNNEWWKKKAIEKMVKDRTDKLNAENPDKRSEECKARDARFESFAPFSRRNRRDAELAAISSNYDRPIIGRSGSSKPGTSKAGTSFLDDEYEKLKERERRAVRDIQEIKKKERQEEKRKEEERKELEREREQDRQREQRDREQDRERERERERDRERRNRDNQSRYSRDSSNRRW